MNHLDDLTINAIADGEQDDGHLRQCAQCAAAVLDVVRMKHAIRALPRNVGRVLNPSAAATAAALGAADGFPTSRGRARMARFISTTSSTAAAHCAHSRT